VDELVSKDGDVGPLPTWTWSIDPNNATSLNAHRNLASHTGPMVLVRVPLFVERMWLVNAKVGSVNRGFALPAPIVLQTIGPADPKETSKQV